VGRDETASEWLPAAIGADSVVLYMAAGASQSIARELIAAGKPASTPVALVESATLPEEKRLFTTLAEMEAETLPRAAGPVVMCVGEVFVGSDPGVAWLGSDPGLQDLIARCKTG
jgi:uroporphyrin-III C-methyltransferase